MHISAFGQRQALDAHILSIISHYDTIKREAFSWSGKLQALLEHFECKIQRKIDHRILVMTDQVTDR